MPRFMIMSCKSRELNVRQVLSQIFRLTDGCLMFRDRVCVLKNDDLVRRILQEAHDSQLSIHPGSTKMYNDLKKRY